MEDWEQQLMAPPSESIEPYPGAWVFHRDHPTRVGRLDHWATTSGGQEYAEIVLTNDGGRHIRRDRWAKAFVLLLEEVPDTENLSAVSAWLDS